MEEKFRVRPIIIARPMLPHPPRTTKRERWEPFNPLKSKLWAALITSIRVDGGASVSPSFRQRSPAQRKDQTAMRCHAN